MLSAFALLTLEHFPFPSPSRFPSSIRKPESESRLLYTGRRAVANQVSSTLFSQSTLTTLVSTPSEALSTPIRGFLAFVSLIPTGRSNTAPFDHNVHHHGPWTAAACGCLKSLPAERLRGAFPHLSSMKLPLLLWHHKGKGFTLDLGNGISGWVSLSWSSC